MQNLFYSVNRAHENTVRNVLNASLMLWAKFSGVTIFDHSDYNILSGCQKIPTPGSKFCSDHEHEKTPCIDKVTEKTKETLDRKDQFDNDDIFIIESIVKMKPKEVLVKWAGFN